MSQSICNNSFLLLLVFVILYAAPVKAFGAGNIPEASALDGHNWRHGDIADILYGLPLSYLVGKNYRFTALDIKRIYFGNWLRDYSQIMDVAALSKAPAEILRALVAVLAFMQFGFTTDEFEVTPERLGVYTHSEHIDNPKGYDKDQDVSEFNTSLAGPDGKGATLRGNIDPRELDIDPKTGMKNYIANDSLNLPTPTAAAFIKKSLTRVIELGREARRTNDQNKQNEAYRLLGGALHTLEDFSAHSNYVELCLRLLGVDAFTYVGDNCPLVEVTSPNPTDDRKIKVQPLVTGTFGFVDFLASITGEIDDKVGSANLQDIEVRLHQGSDIIQASLQQFLDVIKVAKHLFGGEIGGAADMANQLASGNKRPWSGDEIMKNPIGFWDILKPILEFRDYIYKTVIPNLPAVVQQVIADLGALSNALDAFIFSLLAPIIKPLIEHLSGELKDSAHGFAIASQVAEDEIFNPTSTSSNPTHTLLAKDHFVNLLNKPAGLVATVATNLTVQTVTKAWDDPNISIEQATNECLTVLHHPYFADTNSRFQMKMFGAVKRWWEEKSDNERQELSIRLTKESIIAGRNKTEERHLHNFNESNKNKKGAVFDGSAPAVMDPEQPNTADLLLADAAREALKLAASGAAVVSEAIDTIGKGKDVVVETVDEFGKTVQREVLTPIGDGISKVADTVVDGFGKVTKGAVDAGSLVLEATQTVCRPVTAAADMGNVLASAVYATVEKEYVAPVKQTVDVVINSISQPMEEVVGFFKKWTPW